jgi:hypothetical protein
MSAGSFAASVASTVDFGVTVASSDPEEPQAARIMVRALSAATRLRVLRMDLASR